MPIVMHALIDLVSKSPGQDPRSPSGGQRVEQTQQRLVGIGTKWRRECSRPQEASRQLGAAARQCYRGTGSLSGAAAKRAGPGRCRLDPVELDHHLTLPKSRESLALGVEPREGLQRRSGAAPARDMKGVSWTRGRAIHVDDQGSSGAFPEREDNLKKQLALWKRGGAARVEDKIRSSLW